MRAATTEEIERRVEEADTARSAKRTATAKRVGELAHLRAEAAQKLADIERELGNVLAEASDVIGVNELATFTDVPATDLSQWLNGHKTTRSKRKRIPTSIPVVKASSTAKTTVADEAPEP